MKIKGLFDFISKTPTAYHTVSAVKERLLSLGYKELCNGGDEPLEEGGRYFTVRNGSSVIAFRYNGKCGGFMIAASHSDTPSFRVKMSPELEGAYTRLATEKYGGSIHYSWLDRPLSVAGRVITESESGIREQLVDLNSPVCVIPSVAIHLRRNVNDGVALNPAVDMLPLFGKRGAGTLTSLIAEKLSVSEGDIISHDLFLYAMDEPRFIGRAEEFILSPRLDDAGCVYTSLEGFLAAEDTDSTPVLAIFDNEEVGSETKQGAASDFLLTALRRIAGDRLPAMLARSFMVSADNAHALHPNHPELSDAKCAPTLGGGVVIKFNASQRYATDGISAAVFEKICKRRGVPVQYYYNRADLPGGSTLGSISDTKVSIPTVDIGLPQLAMHSAVETVGTCDIDLMTEALSEFYSSTLVPVEGGYEIVKGK